MWTGTYWFEIGQAEVASRKTQPALRLGLGLSYNALLKMQPALLSELLYMSLYHLTAAFIILEKISARV